MKRDFNRAKWTILFLASQICLSACAFFEFTGDLQVSPNTDNNGNGRTSRRELIYDIGSMQEFSYQSDLFSFNVSICQFGASRLSAGLCRLIAEVIDRDGPGTGVSSARWDVSNEGLFDNKDTGYYLNVTAEGVETISRSFRIVTSDTRSPSSLSSSTATITTIPSSILMVPPTLTAASDKTSAGTANQSSSTNSSSSDSDTGAKTNTLNTRQIAGIAIGTVIAVFVIILAAWYIMRRRGLTIAIIAQADRTKSAKHQMQDREQVGFTSETGLYLKGGSEIAGTPICEADGDMKDVTVRHELCDDRPPELEA